MRITTCDFPGMKTWNDEPNVGMAWFYQERLKSGQPNREGTPKIWIESIKRTWLAQVLDPENDQPSAWICIILKWNQQPLRPFIIQQQVNLGMQWQDLGSRSHLEKFISTSNPTAGPLWGFTRVPTGFNCCRLLLPTELRRRLLWRSKCFECQCERCVAQDDIPSCNLT